MPTPISESVLEQQFIGQLEDLKYAYRGDIRDRASLHVNFREKFESLNRCKLTDKEFDRLLQQIVRQDVFHASRASASETPSSARTARPSISSWLTPATGARTPSK